MKLPESFWDDDGIDPRLNICAAINADHPRPWILDGNSERIVRLRFASAFIEITAQYVRGTYLIVSQNQRLQQTANDEIILEVPEKMADGAAAILRETTIEAGRAYLSKVPVEVEVTVEDPWAEKQTKP